MAARTRSLQPTNARPSSAVHGEGDSRRSESPVASKLFGTLLIATGIVLYVYILYIILANLLYPSSLAPFLRRAKNTLNATDSAQVPKGAPNLRESIVMDAALLCLFAVQHSLLATQPVKNVFASFGLSAVCRLVYIFTTCCTIQLMSHFWYPVPSYTLWDCSNQSLLSHVLKVVHMLCWFSLACSVFTIDYLELLGIKQLYYSYSGFHSPIHYKSAEQQNLLNHMRHPIFTTPLIILWAIPSMSYDRLLVAVMLPLYMAWGSRITIWDAAYVKHQFVCKWQQLLHEGNEN